MTCTNQRVAALKGHEQKKCVFCGSPIVKKNGFKKGVQMYKCHACWRQFQAGERLNPEALLEDYVHGKQTYAQLAEKHHCSARTIQRHIDKAAPRAAERGQAVANVVMDTTYFSDIGVMVFKNSLDGSILHLEIVAKETVKEYVRGLEHIKGMGYSVQAIVADGRRGIFEAFAGIPVQLCHFHQVKTVTKYLTKKPKIEAAKELRELTLRLKDSCKSDFVSALDEWLAKWRTVLDERTTFVEDGHERSEYTHMNLRKAYRSLRRNIPHLFVFEEWKELDIPNTTNCLDGHFSDLKNKLRNHNGMKRERKIKVIVEYFNT